MFKEELSRSCRPIFFFNTFPCISWYQGAQLGERFQQIKDTHEALVERATLIVDNQPHYYPLNLCSFMEEGAIRWPFTSKVIPNPVVDWSKPPIYDEEPFVGDEIIPKKKEDPSSSLKNTNLVPLLRVLGSLIKSVFRINCDEDVQNFQYMYPFWEPIEDLAGKIHWIPHLMHVWKEIAPLNFEDYLKFTFKKINLTYEIDADKFQQAKLFETMETQ